MVLIAVGPLTLSALIAALMGAIGFAVGKYERLEGEAYYREHIEGRLRRRGYAFRHPLEAAKRAARRFL